MFAQGRGHQKQTALLAQFNRLKIAWKTTRKTTSWFYDMSKLPNFGVLPVEMILLVFRQFFRHFFFYWIRLLIAISALLKQRREWPIKGTFCSGSRVEVNRCRWWVVCSFCRQERTNWYSMPSLPPSLTQPVFPDGKIWSRRAKHIQSKNLGIDIWQPYTQLPHLRPCGYGIAGRINFNKRRTKVSKIKIVGVCVGVLIFLFLCLQGFRVSWKG